MLKSSWKIPTPNNTCTRYMFNSTDCVPSNISSCIDTSRTESCTDGHVYNTTTFTQTVVTEFDLVCENRYLNTLSTSVYYVGLLIGSFFFGNFCDAFGRKTTCVICFAGVLISSFGWTYSTNVWMYIVCRTSAAVFGYACNLASYVYVMEIAGKTWRAYCALFSGCWFSIGYIIQSYISYNWRDWHQIMLICTLITTPFMLFAIIIPESPRWLFVKNKDKEGIKVVKRMTQLNGTQVEKQTWLDAQTAGNKEKERMSTRRLYSTMDLFRYPRTRLITVNLCISWFVANVVYYGLALNAGALPGSIFVNAATNGVMEMLSNIFCIIVINKVGRRFLLTCTMILSALALGTCAILTEVSNGDHGILKASKVLAFAGKFGISAAFSCCYILAAELYPTMTRAIAVGTASTVSRFGSILCPYIIMLKKYKRWLPNTVFAVLGLLAGGLALLYPETNGSVMLESLQQAEEFYKTGKVKNIIEEESSTSSSCVTESSEEDTIVTTHLL